MLGLREKRVRTLKDEDDFIRRLSSSVIGGGMLHEGNVYLMDYAIKHAPKADGMLEIGSWAGQSSCLLLHLMKKHQRSEQLLGCDPWIYEGYHDHKGAVATHVDGNENLSREDYMTYIHQAFVNAAKLFHPDRLPCTFHCTSDAFFTSYGSGETMTDVFGREHVPQGSLSFAYVDGDHAYDVAKRDVEHVMEYLVSGGFLLLDDSADGAPFGSAHLAKELCSDPRLKRVDRNPNYLFRKVD